MRGATMDRRVDEDAIVASHLSRSGRRTDTGGTTSASKSVPATFWPSSGPSGARQELVFFVS